MKLPILASLIIFVSILSGLRKRHTKETQNAKQLFWDKELAANNVRKKPLDDLNYITIPLDTLPTQVMRDNERVLEYISIIETLSTEKIVNFNGITNTDLKLTYGTANITALSAYVHGAAGDSLAEEFSHFGVTPSDLPREMARILRELEKAKNA